MASSISNRLKHAWNAFTGGTNEAVEAPNYGGYYTSTRPDRIRFSAANERSIITSIFNRIAIDVASVDIFHVRLDGEDRFIDTITSGLQNCLTLEANLDQEARAFRQDIVMSLCETGAIAVVPVDTDLSPVETGGYNILTMRVGRITAWYPRHVRVELYDDRDGQRKEVTLPKATVAIIENPLYSVMNERNSTLQRLIRKLNLLDVVDEASSSGKLDIIVQLPYTIKSEARRQQAEERRTSLEAQLKGSQYGIAYMDATEKITQLNRPAENNMLAQVQFLTTMLYGQLGITEEVMNGTADEKAMLNYFNRTIEPFLAAIAGEFRRKFLTKTARTQKQDVRYYRDPFKLVPINEIAEIADKFTRNEIVSSNEIRGFIGMRPSKDPKADQLVNSNMPGSDSALDRTQPSTEPSSEEVDNQNGSQ